MSLRISGVELEHRVRMPAARRAGHDKGSTTPEQLLNCFVRVVTVIERVGNALGVLAFTWATVVLLGGYPTVLMSMDFWCATVIVFLEAARMFSRNKKLDYQLFFDTKGAFRRLGSNGLIVIVYLSNILNCSIAMAREKKILDPVLFTSIVLLVLPPVLGTFQFLGVPKLFSKPLRRAISVSGPLVAILLMVPSIAVFPTKHRMVKWIVFVLLFLLVLLLTSSRLHYAIITRLVDSALGTRKAFWRRRVLNLCMFAALVMLVLMPDDPVLCGAVFIYQVYALVVVSFGNLQIPAAVTRIGLAVGRLVPHNYYGDDAKDRSKTHLGPTLNIFYGMVLSQGILYVAACIFEVFSFIPKRSLARRGELRGQWGKECVNLYYAYAFDKSMEGDVLAPKKICLDRFAIDCLHSDTPKKRLHGVRVMQSLLLREETRKRLFSELTTSAETVAKLILMLDFSSPENTTIRLFAAKVTAELATSLRVITIPGATQVISGLLDSGNQQQRANPLLNTDTDDEHEKIPDPVQNIDDNHEQRPDAGQGTGNNLLLETREHTTQQVVGTTEQHKSWILTCWQRIFGSRSIPQQEEPKPLTEQDLLPALGMSILGRLAGCDQDNCVEISRTSGLIPKIISFTSYGRRSDTMYTDTQRNVLMVSSLKLLHSLTSIHGEIGITLRHKVSKNPFLLRNLADVLGDSTCSQELKKLAAGILRNLAIERDARQAIGRIQMIISRLIHVFLSTPDGSSMSTESDRLLRKAAGQALAMLAIDSVDNCLAMLREPKYEVIKELTSMIHVDRYRSVAASLLRNMCQHARLDLKEPDLKDLSYSLREVLERIMDTEGAELEILIDLSSQICQVIPGAFARELEHDQMIDRFVKRLVDALNANTEPSADCPGIRRVIVEQAISLMEHDLRYADCFNHRRMMEALETVEETASDVENYSLLLGDAGLIETKEPLPRLVARAKRLLAAR